VKRIQVGLAMSGGVDSTSTALMLKDDYNVTGFFMQLAQPDLPQQIERVNTIADQIDIPLKIIDLSKQFEECVLNYFSNSYFSGLTPNPCMICNREIKFGLFMDAMIDTGMERIATGHYARVEEKNGAFHLLKGIDPSKDQSYFLSRLSQKQLSRIFFPLGKMFKTEIYDYAEKAGFTKFRGKESQDICFLEKESVGEFLRTRFPQTSRQGLLKTIDGKVLGNHKGLHHYTIGQRRGLGISDKTPYYVIRLDPVDDSVIVGKNDDLFRNTILMHNTNWISSSMPNLDQEYNVRIRYSHKGSMARLTQLEGDRFQLNFDSQQRAVTPGQFAVIYKDDEVLGSGEIYG
jgi:tRNA-specific 2-thiouridylase